MTVSGIRSAICLAALLLCLDATAAQASSPSTADPFETVQTIFNENCVSCHNSAQALSGLNLEEGFAQASLVSVKSRESGTLRVQPGNPDKSYLYLKITGRQFEVGGQGDLMPIGGVPLPAEKIEAIREWIASGAAGKAH